MARIPDNEIERLKQEVSIQRLAEARGVILRKRGDELMGLCPFPRYPRYPLRPRRIKIISLGKIGNKHIGQVGARVYFD